MNIKTMQDSRTIQASLVQPSDTNYHGTIFGGSMMAYIDEVAAIAAMRHSRRPVVTASIDSIDFLAPVKMGHSICLEAIVTSTGRTSMEVFVKVISENLQTGERILTATSFLTFVALDEAGNPTEVPGIVAETDEEKRLMASAEERKKMRKERKANTQAFISELTIEKTI
ncbi:MULTISPECIES: acyl-CoA thioesterase [Brevibacillus]|jgi:acyl-CoA hydrolase|uniref:Acyl-CoA hydrolase n=2 Tax=Brevibacillus TaxID=55080 RepID=A0A1I3TRN9_9BACL|nr:MULTISPECIES: acyl-CoA thioesterase [Brevibacillus]MDR7317678.1 acyl-CoA hydrolase [Brevibacillus nitrificans]MEC2132461.1 acyl-CoA thioesterase [Brevibacillus centrosporus]MED1794137.1 acyl-CoA thioesterase [Brevibacillus nitrificans]MED4908560.1 acyl-CoA thioesterase [Brevibacillus centrosporus]RNB69785.1 acyl-CoA thioesterase [Brevibacillus centrosporus]